MFLITEEGITDHTNSSLSYKMWLNAVWYSSRQRWELVNTQLWTLICHLSEKPRWNFWNSVDKTLVNCLPDTTSRQMHLIRDLRRHTQMNEVWRSETMRAVRRNQSRRFVDWRIKHMSKQRLQSSHQRWSELQSYLWFLCWVIIINMSCHSCHFLLFTLFCFVLLTPPLLPDLSLPVIVCDCVPLLMSITWATSPHFPVFSVCVLTVPVHLCPQCKHSNSFTSEVFLFLYPAHVFFLIQPFALAL